jgi:type 1 fimbria pilin
MNRHFHFWRSVIRLTLVLGLLAAGSAQAVNCTISNAPAAISFGAVTVPRDVPIGMAIGPVVTSTASVSCPYIPNAVNNSYYLQVFSSLQASGLTGVWATGMAGIGVRVSNGNTVFSGYAKNDFAPAVPKGAANTTYTATFTFQYQLVKTAAQVTTGGPLNVSQMFYLISHDVPNNVDSGVQGQTGINNTTITVATCSVMTNPVNVMLPTLSANTLNAAGTTGGATDFQIQLQCGAGANVHVTLTDATNPGNTTSQLTLTSDSGASGVRLQILKSDGSAVTFGPDSAAAGNPGQWLAGSADSTSAIPLTAQYISTGAVTPGTVKASATFTLSYQ